MKSLNFILLYFFSFSILFMVCAAGKNAEHLGREGPPPAGPEQGTTAPVRGTTG